MSKRPPWHRGPNVDVLIEQHRAAIGEMLSSCEGLAGFKPGVGEGFHDELFALRFLLSHKLRPDKAGAAMRATIEWRRRHNVDALREFVLGHRQEDFPLHDHCHRYFWTPIYIPRGADSEWPPFMLINSPILHPSALMKRITIDDYVVYSMHMSEWMAAHCDRITRKTRHLTKAVRVVALGGLRLRHASMAFARAASAAAKDHVDCYPQNLGHLFICNAPRAMKIIWDTAVGPLLPERVVEKTCMINPAHSDRDLDILTDHIPIECIPECIYDPRRRMTA